MIGDRIRAKRNEQSMSMKELAELTGLTSGFISQVERELAEPSIASLRKISNALGVAMFHFFIEEDRQSQVIRRHDREDNSSEKGPSMALDEKAIYVIEGQMDITIDSDQYTLYHGDTIYYYADSPYKITNAGQEKLVYVSSITSAER